MGERLRVGARRAALERHHGVCRRAVPHVPDRRGFPIGSMVHVDTAGGGRANLRSAPSISAGVITTIPNGLTGEVRDGPVSANGYTWYKVWFGDVQGWMASVVLAAGGGSDRPRVEVASGPLRVRQQPGLGGAILGTVLDRCPGVHHHQNGAGGRRLRVGQRAVR